jgi:Cu/Ag efflux pump CusA
MPSPLIAAIVILLFNFQSFNSLKQATLTISNTPLALTGGFNLMFPSCVGFIASLDVAVLAGVAMVGCFKTLPRRTNP